MKFSSKQKKKQTENKIVIKIVGQLSSVMMNVVSECLVYPRGEYVEYFYIRDRDGRNREGVHAAGSGSYQITKILL